MNTTNYNLVKKETGDNIKNNLLVVGPANLDKIDAQMKINADGVSGLLLTVSTLKLESNVLKALTIKDNTTVGTEIGEHTQVGLDAFSAEIDAAKIISDDSDSKNQQELSDAIADLATAKATFLTAVVPAGDPAVLVASIASAQIIHDNAVEGEYDGQYIAGYKAVLQTAIATAQSVVDTPSLQSVIDAEDTELGDAVTFFNAGEVTTTIVALEASIVVAEGKRDNAVAGAEVGNYNQVSIDDLDAAITTAQLVVTNVATTNQTDIDLATTNLDDSVVTFDSSVIV